MPTLARKPARGNWIWLGGALCAVLVLAAVAVGATIGGHTAGGPRATPSPPGSGSQASGLGAAQGNGGPPVRRATGGPGGGRYLAGTSAVAVFYDPGHVVGSCSLGPFPARGRYVSLPPQRFGRSAACGSYLTVQGPRGRVRAEVVDLCPGCAAGMINLSRAAFTRIADAGPGSARVRFWPDDDPPLPGPLILRMGQTRPGLVTVQVRRHGNALASVAVAPPGMQVPAWQPFALNANGIWVAGSHLGQGPFNIRIADTRGHQVVIPRVILRPGRVIRTRTWMYGHGQAG
jgi:expansin (peptidoglycan-binding protein)